MSKVIKQMQMDAMKARFDGVRDMVFLTIVGLNSQIDNQTRLALRKKKIYLHVVKNSLARRVFTDMGMTINNGWAGPTTVAWGAGSLSELSRELETLIKKNKQITPKIAVSEGQEVSFEQAVKMPTRAEAVARVIMLALAPASRIASQLAAPSGKIASQVKTISEKKEEAAPAEGAPAEAAPAS